MNKLLLHIGCMKTGSSALQVWLAENVMALREKGVDYPLTLGRPEHAYHITSGNGQEAIAALKCGQGRAYFSTLCTSAAPKVLLSTEMFQDLGYEEISGLREVLESLEVEVTVIAFVRDIYEYIFSLYGQGVKRHLECRTFREYALDPDLKIGELDALDAWARYFDDVRVLHYDSLKDRLDTAFLEAIGLQSGDAAAMPATRVNRSLTLEELEYVRQLNGLYQKRFGGQLGHMFSMYISDSLIYANPELVGETLLDESVAGSLVERFSKRVGEVNQRFFDGKPVLSVLPVKQSPMATSVGELPLPFRLTLAALMNMIAVLNVSYGGAAEGLARLPPLEVGDSRLAPALIQEAMACRDIDVHKALALMEAARLLQPDDPEVGAKIEEYCHMLRLENASV